MAMIIVNGQETVLGRINTLQDFLDKEGYADGRVAVEKNGCIVPRAEFGIEPLIDGDMLEIVAFIGGG